MTQSDETTLLIPKLDNAEHQWTGLQIKELREYCSDPFWVRLRCLCFGIFWCTFVLLFLAVIFLVSTAHRCHKLDWWQQGPMYGIYSNSTHNGLSGIESRLDYIVELGVKTIWLSPIYKSPMKDFGYDIQDFKDIDSRFGSIQDFKDLVAAMKAKNLRLVMDLVPNHSSDQHEWFQKSVAKLDPYTNYYVWVDPKDFGEDGKPIPPNNWLSVSGKSAWEWNEHRKQFYLHQFTKEQPDLNFRNSAVKQEILDVMKFWLELGVDGFRVDAMPHLFEDELLRDEPMINETKVLEGDYNGLQHLYTYNLPEVLDIMAELRNALDTFSENTDKVRRLIMAEVYDSVEKTIEYYSDTEHPITDFPFNFYIMTNITRDSSAHSIMETIQLWMNNLPQEKWANWVLGNHDHGRVASHFGGDLVDCLNMILLMLPGTAVTYYGEELGMENAPVSWELKVDPADLNAVPQHSRDPERTQMQWDSGKNAEFSDADVTWLPLRSSYKEMNVETELQVPSHLSIYKALVRARSDISVMYGSLHMKVFGKSVFAFTRCHADSRNYVVAVNWSNRSEIINLTEFDDIPEVAEVYVTSVNFITSISKTIKTGAVKLHAREGIVLTYASDKK